MGWAPGNSNVPPVSPIGDRDDDPVWFTTLSATTIAVDFDGDPSTGAITIDDCFGANHDLDLPVSALASTRIYDPNDGDMTGARVYTCDGTPIAGAWGEDPQNAPAGSPGFDAGYTVIPTTTMLVRKTATSAVDTDNDGRIGPGDTITYVIAIADAGSLAFSNVKAADTLPAGLTYKPNSTVFDNGSTITPITDDGSGSAFPLDDTGLGIPNIGAGDTVEVRFDATIDNPFTSGSSIGNTACVTAEEASACDTSVTALPRADLSLAKTITNPATHAGDNVTFHLAVTNDGPDDAGSVVVNDPLPSGLSFVSASSGSYDSNSGVWSVGPVANGATVTVDVTAKVTASNVTNVAEIVSASVVDPDSVPDDGQGDDYATANVTVAPSADIEVTNVVTDAPTFLGDSVTFLVTVTNKGPSDATGLTIANVVPSLPVTSATPSGGYFSPDYTSWKVPNLASGASETLTITATMLSTLPVSSIAELVHGNEFDPDSTVNNGVTTEDDYAVAIVSTVPAGAIGGHVFDDRNGNGTQDNAEPGIEGAVVTLRQNITDQFVSSMPTIADGSFDFGTLLPDGYYLDITSLPAGYVCTNCLAPTLFTLGGGQQITTANYGYRAEADLSVTNQVTASPAHVGDAGQYTVTLTNDGPATATNVTVHDLLPLGATFVGATASAGTYAALTGDWTIPSLASGASATLVINVTVTTHNELATTAEVTASDQPDPDSTPNNHDAAEDDQDVATISAAALIDVSLTQSVDKATAGVGDDVTFTLIVTNDGPSPATNVAVQDTLPSGLQFTSATASQGGCVASLCTVGTLAANGTATITVRATVTAAGAHENLAQVVAATEHDVDSVPGENALDASHAPDQDDESAATVTGEQIDLSLKVKVDDTSVPVGDSVLWTVVVRNAGPSTATDVQVSDVLPAGLRFVNAAPLTGVFANDTWTIASLAPDAYAVLTIRTVVETAGAHVNTAQVKAANEPDLDSTPNNNVAIEDDQAAATVTGTVGSVPGSLWIDTNRNGVQDPGEPAMPAVVLNLVDEAGHVVATTTTDSQGDYSFPNVAPGDYTIEVVKSSIPDTLKQIFDVDALLDGKHKVTVTGLGATPTNFAYVSDTTTAAAELPRTGGTAQLPLIGLLVGAVLALRARRRALTPWDV